MGESRKDAQRRSWAKIYNVIWEIPVFTKEKGVSCKLLKRKRCGFTLIELLVVISIIALLLSILMPALSRVKEQARSLICATNLKTLFTAWALYADENKDMVCSPYTYRATSGIGVSDTSSWAWAPWDEQNNIAVLTTPTEEEQFEGTRKGSLFIYTEDPQVYACKNKVVDNRCFRSYSIPDSLGGYWGRSAPDGQGFDDYSMIYKSSRLTRPSSRYIYIEENDWRDFLYDSFVLAQGTITNKTQHIWGDPITIRHAGLSNFVFGDGHTEFKKWSNETVDIMEYPATAWNTIATTEPGREDIDWLRDHWPK